MKADYDNAAEIPKDIIQLGISGFSYNKASECLYYKATYVSLEPRESQIFKLLIDDYDRVVPKEKFLGALYGFPEDRPNYKVIDVFISKLRLKMNKVSGVKGIGEAVIQGIWGRGYLINRDEDMNRLLEPLGIYNRPQVPSLDSSPVPPETKSNGHIPRL